MDDSDKRPFASPSGRRQSPLNQIDHLTAIRSAIGSRRGIDTAVHLDQPKEENFPTRKLDFLIEKGFFGALNLTTQMRSERSVLAKENE
ncbi:hypothetical protein RUM44_005948 [Polyplax serrata]|uniref:Uncharacterized protein n=1 Tax=Polyplax serrata TaxID=468196 RepID=A0ABR1B0E4_POLSC